MEIDYDYVNGWDGKGWALNELGNYTQAITYFDRALQINPTLVDSLYLKGEALYGLGNYTGAEHFISKAFATGPNNEFIKKKMQNRLFN